MMSRASAIPSARNASTGGATANATATTPTCAASTEAEAKVTPTVTFSALPTGPLATVVLFLEEGDLAQLLCANKDVHASELDSAEFWRDRCRVTFGRHVDFIQDLGKDAFRAFLTAKRHLPGYSQPQAPVQRGSSHSADEGERFHRVICGNQLFAKCVAVSSQDNHDEKPGNTLVPSLCAMRLGEGGVLKGRQSQSECGCWAFSKCYWSSHPSPVANKDEWIEYELADGLAVVSSFVLTPYTSFWQPQQPTYNPVEACFQLAHPRIDGGRTPYYESPRFRVDGSMKRQQFDLQQPILSLGGRAKILLLGMAQRQTLPEGNGETANHYYICLSYAALSGVVLRSCCLRDVSVRRSLAAERSLAAPAPAPVPTGVEQGDGGAGYGGAAPERQSAMSQEAGSCVRAGAGAAESQSAGAGENQPQTRMRLQWVVEVFVHPAPPRDGCKLNRHNTTAKRQETYAYSRSPLKIKAFSDTPCLEVVERYSELVGFNKTKGVGSVQLMMLAGDAGSELVAFPPDDGANLGGFATGGCLDLVDTSINAE